MEPFDRVEGLIGRYFKDRLQVTAFFVTGVRLSAAVCGDQRLRLRLSLSEGISIAGRPVEAVWPRVSPMG